METIQQLINFCEAIPEENWCSNYYERITFGGVVQRCITGHLNHHLTGDAIYKGISVGEPCLRIIKPLGLDRGDIVRANNRAEINNSPKQSVLKYLKDQQAQHG